MTLISAVPIINGRTAVRRECPEVPVDESDVTASLSRTVSDGALRELDGLETLEALEAWRVSHLGRRGRLTTLLRGVGEMPPEARRSVGDLGNRTKSLLESVWACVPMR